ncbi:MAG: hypothetical protein WCA08_11340 [Desulfoferrobacter sp.]
MPYGADVQKLDSVFLADGLEIAVHPEVMKMLNLQPGQTVDEETAKKIVAENDRMVRVK